MDLLFIAGGRASRTANNVEPPSTGCYQNVSSRAGSNNASFLKLFCDLVER